MHGSVACLLFGFATLAIEHLVLLYSAAFALLCLVMLPTGKKIGTALPWVP